MASRLVYLDQFYYNPGVQAIFLQLRGRTGEGPILPADTVTVPRSSIPKMDMACDTGLPLAVTILEEYPLNAPPDPKITF
jgi:hypothetical protein